MEEQQEQQDNRNFSLEIRLTAKGEKTYTYKIRADDIETLTIRQQEVKRLAEIECNKDGVKNE